MSFKKKIISAAMSVSLTQTVSCSWPLHFFFNIFLSVLFMLYNNIVDRQTQYECICLIVPLLSNCYITCCSIAVPLYSCHIPPHDDNNPSYITMSVYYPVLLLISSQIFFHSVLPSPHFLVCILFT